jgi:hypothetical protein
LTFLKVLLGCATEADVYPKPANLASTNRKKEKPPGATPGIGELSTVLSGGKRPRGLADRVVA